MKTIYIQSKSGNFNTTTKDDAPLDVVFNRFRKAGGYYAKPGRHGNYSEVFVPFEEIEYIAEEAE